MPCIVNDLSREVCQNSEARGLEFALKRNGSNTELSRREPLQAHANIINDQMREQQVEEMP